MNRKVDVLELIYMTITKQSPNLKHLDPFFSNDMHILMGIDGVIPIQVTYYLPDGVVYT